MAPCRVVLPPGSWRSVLDFLAERFPRVGHDAWSERLARGDVLGADHTALAPGAAYVAGSWLYYYRSVPAEVAVPSDLQVLHRDDELVVVDKPHFLPVLPSGSYLEDTVLARLRRSLGIDTLAPLHRIDRETAGLVLCSTRRLHRGAYAALFRTRAVEKVYEAIAPAPQGLALPATRSSRIDDGAHFMQRREVDGPANSHTALRLLEQSEGWGRYELRPSTGQRHQLRVHMMALGRPIAGDGIYPVLQPAGPPDLCRPLQLLARSLAFTDPTTGRDRHFESRRRLDLQEFLSGRAPGRSPD